MNSIDSKYGWRAFVIAASILSGAVALAYELIWFKRFAHSWGSSADSLAAVVAAFLLGLAIGAYVLGRIADRGLSLFWLYGCCEIGIGIWALVVPLLIGVVVDLVPVLSDLAGSSRIARFILQFALTTLVIGPGCFLMGGTFPILVRIYSAVLTPGTATGLIYGLNTIGAALGCLLAGFMLVPLWGLVLLNGILALCNIGMGVTALFLSKHLISTAREVSEDRPFEGGPFRAGSLTVGPSGVSYSAYYFSAFLVGCSGLIMQIVWNRQVALAVGGSTYAFSATLFCILLGIGFGSLLGKKYLVRMSNGFQPTIVLMSGALSALVCGFCLPGLCGVVGCLKPLRGSSMGNLFVCIVPSICLVLVPAVFAGVALPLLVNMVHPNPRAAGTAAGAMYAWNTTGTVAGVCAAHAVLIPSIGMSATYTLSIGLMMFAAFLIGPRRKMRDRVVTFSILAFGGLIALLASKEADPRYTNMGMYLYGFRDLGELKRSEVLYFREGVTCNVLITEREGHRYLYVNGKVDASTNTDMTTQLGLAYYPVFLRPRASRILIIGYGSGTTTGAAALFPNAAVECCELEPAVVAGSHCFWGINHKADANPRVRLIVEDGRSYVQRGGSGYDLIISEPSNPWMAGVANLFTVEFYEAAKSRLATEGMFIQWVQAYDVSLTDYAMVARSLSRVFPFTCVLQTASRDTLLIGSNAQIMPSRDSLEEAQALVNALPSVRSDLRSHFVSEDVGLLLIKSLLLATDDLSRLLERVGEGQVNTDSNVRLEYELPKRIFSREANRGAELYKEVIGAVPIDELRRLAREWAITGDRLGKVIEAILRRCQDAGMHDHTQELIDWGIGADPDNPVLLVNKVLNGSEGGVLIQGEMITRIAVLSQVECSRLGVELWGRKRFEEAIFVFTKLLEVDSRSSTAWANLGVNYVEIGQSEKGLLALKRAVQCDPLNQHAANALRNLEETMKTKKE